jgi:flagellar hook-basal body complex protein FliE
MPVQLDTSFASPALKDATARRAAPGDSPSGFGNTLEGLLQSVDTSAGAANGAVSAMIDGTGDVHDAMIALQRAETTLELTIQIRNKLVQAYQDIMRMPV